MFGSMHTLLLFPYRFFVRALLMWGVQVNAHFAFVYFMAFASCVKYFSVRCLGQRTLASLAVFCFCVRYLVQRTICFRLFDGFCNSLSFFSVRCLGQRTLCFVYLPVFETVYSFLCQMFRSTKILFRLHDVFCTVLV